MKKIINQFFGIISLMAALFLVSCSDILEEQPRTFFEPGFFKTEKGIQNGLTSLYYHTRIIYGGYYHAFAVNGTDEMTYAQSGDNNQNSSDLSLSGTNNTLFGGGVTPSSDRSDIVWSVFPYINTASGIIENGEEANMPAAFIAEAYFFRAWDYFLLVQTFGGVPLDLGAGEMKFNSEPSRKSVRNTVPEVYTKAIFPDLKKAITDLPLNPRVVGGVGKTVARLYLAKAYLTYGWWLTNDGADGPVDTYPAISRTDPDGHDAKWYFDEAYNIAKTAIDDPGPFGLMNTFFEVHEKANDRNKEWLLYSDHNYNTQYGGFQDNNNSSVGSPRNAFNWLSTWNYTNITSAPDSNPSAPVQREASQALGRPWTRSCPTIEVLTNIFADKTYDSRYDGTFVTTYFANWHKNPADASSEEVTVANGMKVAKGGAILKFVHDVPEGVINYPTRITSPPAGTREYGNSNVGAGEMPGESAWVIRIDDINRVCYPGQWKNGPGRTDYDFNTSLGLPNSSSPRPIPITKFSELYLIAAEAAVMGGNNANAVAMIKVLRSRAGKWSFNLSENKVKTDDFSVEMEATTPAIITIDYILDERMRELYGENLRWYDLVRTHTYLAKAGEYTIGGGLDEVKGNYCAHNPVTIHRALEKKHYLRPIPQSHMDSLEMTDSEKKEYQNPGY